MIRPFYSTGEFAVAEFPNRRVLDEIELVFSALDCLVADDSGVYCGSDVTTGRRLYFEIFEQHGVRSDGELKRKLGAEDYRQLMAELIHDNVARGIEFTDTLRRRGLVNLVNPGPLHARGFKQEHYHYLWECVIIKKIYEIHFNDGWEYSNGCTLEYAVGQRKGIRRLDHSGHELSPPEASRKVEQAVSELKARGISAPMLELNLARIKELL